MGFDEEDFASPTVQVWPENIEAVSVFLAMQTQWRVGMNGRTGMDYSALDAVWPLVGIRRRDRTRVFQEFRIIEIGALNEMNKAD